MRHRRLVTPYVLGMCAMAANCTDLAVVYHDNVVIGDDEADISEVNSALPIKEAIVMRADFEEQSEASPPTGWSMWGSQQYKDPANFSCDTQAPHSGSGCFRIHHPANTKGYVVSDPEQSVRTKRGEMLILTFWARSDKRGHAVFGWTGYQSIAPYVNAPSPGLRSIPLDRRWRRFEFVIHEGWDYFVDECRHLLLTFKSTNTVNEERTLWIDDLMLTRQPSNREGRLLNPNRMQYEPLNHRLTPGESLDVRIDTHDVLRKSCPEVGGVSFHRVAGWTGFPYDREGRYRLPDDTEHAIRELHLPMTRFYALGDEPFGLNAAIDKAAAMLDRVGISQEQTPLEFEIQSAVQKLSPKQWADGVRHSLDRGFNFHRWEIANEPHVPHPGNAFANADDYVQHVTAVAQAIREADPDARIGMSVCHRSPAWGNQILKKASGTYDWVAGHYYCFTSVENESFEEVVLTSNYQILDDIIKTNRLIREYNPGREVYQCDTEWGMHSSGPNGEKADYVPRNGNIYGMTHRAVRLIHYLREGMLQGASSWVMFSRERAPGFAVLSKEDAAARSMNYWLYYHFNRHVGSDVLAFEGSAPYHARTLKGRTLSGPLTPMVATRSKDGKHVYLMIANGSWTRDTPCCIDVGDVHVYGAKGVLLSNSDRDANPFLDTAAGFAKDFRVAIEEESHITCVIPSHSVVFITLML